MMRSLTSKLSAVALALLTLTPPAMAGECPIELCFEDTCFVFDLCPQEEPPHWRFDDECPVCSDIFEVENVYVNLVIPATREVVVLGSSRVAVLSRADLTTVESAVGSSVYLLDPVSGLGQEVTLRTNRSGEIEMEALDGAYVGTLR